MDRRKRGREREIKKEKERERDREREQERKTSPHMSIYIHIHIHTHSYTHTRIYIHLCIHTRASPGMSIYTYVRTYTHAYLSISAPNFPPSYHITLTPPLILKEITCIARSCYIKINFHSSLGLISVLHTRRNKREPNERFGAVSSLSRT